MNENSENLIINDDSSQSSDGKKKKFGLPVAVLVIYAVTAFCALLYLAFVISEPFSDFFNRRVSSVFRAILAHLTSWLPFSLAEFMLILIPVWVFLISRAVIKKYGSTLKETLKGVLCVMSVLGIVFSVFTLNFAAGYRGSTLDEKLGIERQKVSADELYSTSMILLEGIESTADKVCFENGGSSVMPYNYSEMNAKLLDAYDSAAEKYDFIQRLNSRLKPVMLSEPMSYTHITGVYTFFTGEANINVNFPDYCVVYTAAHELAHQRGIAREDEANFMAFLICLESEDAYIRYCGYLNLYEYVASALSQADKTLFNNSYSQLPEVVKSELRAYSEFYKKYEHSTASKVSETVNNTFLTSQGTPGTKSYGMVVDLAVAYYKQ